MSEPKEFAPLMEAIQQVLAELGSSEALEQPLRNSVQVLQRQYDEFHECCCFFAHVVRDDEPASST